MKDLVNGSIHIANTKNGFKQWKSRDLDARMETIMYLSNEQGDHLRYLENAHEIWEYLRKLHQPFDGTT